MTVLVSLADAADWVGLDSEVVLAVLRVAGIPLIGLNSDNNDSDNEIFLEVDLAFAMKVGLPIDMNLLFNQRVNNFKAARGFREMRCGLRPPGQGSGDGTVSKSPVGN